MPANGGLSPGLERYGGGRPGTLEALLKSLHAQRGSLYDTTQPSNVYLEDMAIARALAECWSNNARLANQWDSKRMTEFLSRWEKILGIVPGTSDTDITRRARVAAAFARVTQIGVYQTVYDQLTASLGTIFNGIVHTPSATANIWTPSGWVVNGGSAQVDPTGKIDWYSTTAHILINVTQPAGMNDGVFYSTCASVNPILETLLPAWVTWDFARNTAATPLHVISIASSTNTNPVVFTTNPSVVGTFHGFVVGQTITIAGHTIGSYNGTWVITAVGGTTSGGTGTTFTLTNGAPPANGAGSGGTAFAQGFYLDGDPTLSGSLVNLDNEIFYP